MTVETFYRPARVTVVTFCGAQDLAGLRRLRRDLAQDPAAVDEIVVTPDNLVLPADCAAVEQLAVPRLPGDAGVTARGLGAQLAFNEGADAVCFLDPGQALVHGALQRLIEALARPHAGLLWCGDAVAAAAGAPAWSRWAIARSGAVLAGIIALHPTRADCACGDVLPHVAARLDLPVGALDSAAPAVAPSLPDCFDPVGYYRATGVDLSRPETAQRLAVDGAVAAAARSAPEDERLVPRIAVVTPYHRESLDILRRCHASVQRQPGDVTHFMVADGHARDAIDAWPVVHLKLAREHRDNGNTPRGLGGMLAFQNGYDAVAYLDADNWFADDHLRSITDALARRATDIVTTWRVITFPDGDRLDRTDPEDRKGRHVDTSAILVTRSAAFLARIWAQMPQDLGPVCDRYFMTTARRMGVTEQSTRRPTLYFESNYRCHYRMAGKTRSSPFHELPDDLADRFDALTYRQRTGVSIEPPALPR